MPGTGNTMKVKVLKQFRYLHVTPAGRIKEAVPGQIITDFPELNIESLIKAGLIMEIKEKVIPESAPVQESIGDKKLKPKPKSIRKGKK